MQATKLIFVYCTIMTIVIQLLSMLCHKIQGGIHETLAFYENDASGIWTCGWVCEHVLKSLLLVDYLSASFLSETTFISKQRNELM